MGEIKQNKTYILLVDDPVENYKERTCRVGLASMIRWEDDGSLVFLSPEEYQPLIET